MGDCLSSIWTVMKLGGGTLYLGETEFTPDAKDALMPLLQLPNLKTKIWRGEKIDVNFNLMRNVSLNMSGPDLRLWYCYAFGLSVDISKPWLNMKFTKDYDIVVARSPRYRNKDMSYGFLQQKKLKVGFVGLPDEAYEFTQYVPNAEYIKTENLKEVAQVIASSRVFIANQTSAFWIGEAMGHPKRIVEVFMTAPNCVIQTSVGHHCYRQDHFERAVDELLA
jgi:hypothetical protein